MTIPQLTELVAFVQTNFIRFCLEILTCDPMNVVRASTSPLCHFTCLNRNHSYRFFRDPRLGLNTQNIAVLFLVRKAKFALVQGLVNFCQVSKGLRLRVGFLYVSAFSQQIYFFSWSSWQSVRLFVYMSFLQVS